MSQTEPNVEQKQGFEELQVMGEQLLSKVKELIHEGNVRHEIDELRTPSARLSISSRVIRHSWRRFTRAKPSATSFSPSRSRVALRGVPVFLSQPSRP